jgi:hypothetical protein
MSVEAEGPDAGGVELYTSADGETTMAVRVESGTVWLTFQQMAELFQRDQSVVAKHARNALREGEVAEASLGRFLA